MDARATYAAGCAEAEGKLAAQEVTIRALGFARLVIAGLVVGVIVGLVWWRFPPSSLWALAGLVLLFGVLVLVHARAFDQRERSKAAREFHRRGLSRLDGTWRSFPGDGAAYASAEHPFAEDLDLFGPSSLFQRLDATGTVFGRDALARLLGSAAAGSGGVTPRPWSQEIALRQEAVRELAGDVTFRERLSVEAAILSADTNPEPFLVWAEATGAPEVPAPVVLLARVLPLVVAALVLAGDRLGVPKYSWAVVVAVELALSASFRERTHATVEAVSEHAGAFARYGALFDVVVSRPWSSPHLAQIVAPLRESSGARGVGREMRALERLTGLVEARRNEVFRLFLGPVLMWDLNFAVLLDRWRRRNGSSVRRWFSALGELEALASLAGFAFDCPDHAWPALREEAELTAEALGHPLIDAARRVGNDVSMPKRGTALVVTGSNMSGKSTLLRAIGVNTVLAQAGAPVAARSFILGRVVLGTSMRIKDSLDEGVSHFYAELKKLKAVTNLAGQTVPVLFLLDEILHGTNSRERIIGARAVVMGLLAKGALGAVSTHDLGIAELSATLPSAVRNVHFEEQVAEDGTMTFDYLLREGTVTTSNALRLMRAIGLDVPLGEEPHGA